MAMLKVDSNASAVTKLAYRDRLDPTAKARYYEKLKLIGENDPYEMQNTSADVCLLPCIAYPDIVNFLVYSPSPYTLDDLKSYKGLDAYNQFVSGWVSNIMTVIVQDKHIVKAKVLHSQRMREKSLNPWIIAEKNGKILSSHCDCMAGLGEACTHIAALLFAINGTVVIRDSRTVTQDPAYWLLPTSLKNVSYSETRSIDFSAAKSLKKKFEQSCSTPLTHTPSSSTKKMKTKIAAPTEDELNNFYSLLASSGRKPSILSLIPEHSTGFIPTASVLKFPQILTELKDKDALLMEYDSLLNKCKEIKLTISEEEIKNVEFLTRKQSNCKAWYDYRTGRITASKMRAVCHTNISCPAQSLIKQICYPSAYKFETAATKWGIGEEAVARSKLSEILHSNESHQNLQLEECGLFISNDYPFVAASPDGIVSCDCCGKGCIEIKCPYSLKGEKIKQCKYLKCNKENVLQLDIEHQYFYQVQTQMGVTKTDFCYFVVWTGLETHVEQILFEPEVYANICMKAERFFYQAILPELVGKYYTRLPGSYLNVHHISADGQISKAGDNTVGDGNAEKTWCYCGQVESGKMISCDNENCKIIWFHFTCLKLESKPKSKKWYCPECRKL